MTKINITNQEIVLLQDYAKSSPLLLIQLKAYAVLLAYVGASSETITLTNCRARLFAAVNYKPLLEKHWQAVYEANGNTNETENSRTLVGEEGLEPSRALSSPDFESSVYTNFTTRPNGYNDQ